MILIAYPHCHRPRKGRVAASRSLSFPQRHDLIYRPSIPFPCLRWGGNCKWPEKSAFLGVCPRRVHTARPVDCIRWQKPHPASPLRSRQPAFTQQPPLNHNPTKQNGRGESATTLQIFNGCKIRREGLGDQLFATVVVASSIKHDGFATYCKVHNSHINPAATKHASVLRVVPWRRDSRICARVGWFMAL